MYDKATKDRFWALVKKSSGCWTWTGAKNEKGYGIVKVNGKTERAIRVAYQMTKGAITGDKQVMHSCANTSCVKPAHLSLGTNAENQAERAARASEGALVDWFIDGELTLDETLTLMECIQ